jgi:hypothetical protein
MSKRKKKKKQKKKGKQKKKKGQKKAAPPEQKKGRSQAQEEHLEREAYPADRPAFLLPPVGEQPFAFLPAPNQLANHPSCRHPYSRQKQHLNLQG